MSTDPRVDAYIAASQPFAQPILAWLRARVHAACPEVDETIKWGMPRFMREGRLLAGMAAFRTHASFGFWDRGGMATGREGEAMGQFGRITSFDDLPRADELEAMIRKAAALERSGRPQRAARPEPEVPPALADALERDPAAAAIFAAFPASARRDYCEWISEAKRADTRDRRVADAVGWLREGKRRNWKYESC